MTASRRLLLSDYRTSETVKDSIRSCIPGHREVTYDIRIRGCAYKGSNPDPKYGSMKTVFLNFSA